MSTGIRGHEVLLHHHHHIFTSINASFGFSVSTYTHICLLLLRAGRGLREGESGAGGCCCLFVVGGGGGGCFVVVVFCFVIIVVAFGVVGCFLCVFLLLLFLGGLGRFSFVCLFSFFLSFFLSFCSIVIVRIRNS